MSTTTEVLAGGTAIGTLVPPIRVVLQRSGPAAAIIASQRERNNWYIIGFEGMGQYWADEYLPLRFDRGYASKVLGYQVGGRVPFFESGRLQSMALHGVHVVARAPKAKPYAIIRIPTPPYVNQNRDVRLGLRTVPQVEVVRLARVLERNLILAASTATTRIAQRGPTAGQAKATFRAVGTTSSIARYQERRAALDRHFRLRPQKRRQTLLKTIKTPR